MVALLDPRAPPREPYAVFYHYFSWPHCGGASDRRLNTLQAVVEGTPSSSAPAGRPVADGDGGGGGGGGNDDCDSGSDRSAWGFDLPQRIFETRPDGGHAIRGAFLEQRVCCVF